MAQSKSGEGYPATEIGINILAIMRVRQIGVSTFLQMTNWDKDHFQRVCYDRRGRVSEVECDRAATFLNLPKEILLGTHGFDGKFATDNDDLLPAFLLGGDPVAGKKLHDTIYRVMEQAESVERAGAWLSRIIGMPEADGVLVLKGSRHISYKGLTNILKALRTMCTAQGKSLPFMENFLGDTWPGIAKFALGLERPVIQKDALPAHGGEPPSTAGPIGIVDEGSAGGSGTNATNPEDPLELDKDQSDNVANIAEEEHMDHAIDTADNRRIVADNLETMGQIVIPNMGMIKKSILDDLKEEIYPLDEKTLHALASAYGQTREWFLARHVENSEGEDGVSASAQASAAELPPPESQEQSSPAITATSAVGSPSAESRQEIMPDLDTSENRAAVASHLEHIVTTSALGITKKSTNLAFGINRSNAYIGLLRNRNVRLDQRLLEDLSKACGMTLAELLSPYVAAEPNGKAGGAADSGASSGTIANADLEDRKIKKIIGANLDGLMKARTAIQNIGDQSAALFRELAKDLSFIYSIRNGKVALSADQLAIIAEKYGRTPAWFLVSHKGDEFLPITIRVTEETGLAVTEMLPLATEPSAPIAPEPEAAVIPAPPAREPEAVHAAPSPALEPEPAPAPALVVEAQVPAAVAESGAPISAIEKSSVAAIDSAALIAMLARNPALWQAMQAFRQQLGMNDLSDLRRSVILASLLAFPSDRAEFWKEAEEFRRQLEDLNDSPLDQQVIDVLGASLKV